MSNIEVLKSQKAEVQEQLNEAIAENNSMDIKVLEKALDKINTLIAESESAEKKPAPAKTADKTKTATFAKHKKFVLAKIEAIQDSEDYNYNLSIGKNAFAECLLASKDEVERLKNTADELEILADVIGYANEMIEIATDNNTEVLLKNLYLLREGLTAIEIILQQKPAPAKTADKPKAAPRTQKTKEAEPKEYQSKHDDFNNFGKDEFDFDDPFWSESRVSAVQIQDEAELNATIDKILSTPVSRKKPATTRLKPSYTKDMTMEQIKTLGFVFAMAVAADTCDQIAVELNQDVQCFVKGDATVTAKAGELLIFVHTKGENWRQFNIIGNKNNCALRLIKTDLAGEQKEVTTLAKDVAKKEKAKAEKVRKKRETLNDKMHDAIDAANKKGERKSDDTSYWGGKSKFLAVAKAVMILAKNRTHAKSEKEIVAILRDSNNHIIFEMAEPDGKGFKDTDREYLMLNERKIQLEPAKKPSKPFGLVDARKSEIAKFGKVLEDYVPVSDSRYLDRIYAGRSVEAKECKQLERAARQCQSGNCADGSPEQKELKALEKECTTHLDPYSELMPKVQAAFKDFYKQGFKLYSDKARAGKKMTTAEKFNTISAAEAKN